MNKRIAKKIVQCVSTLHKNSNKVSKAKMILVKLGIGTFDLSKSGYKFYFYW